MTMLKTWAAAGIALFLTTGMALAQEGGRLPARDISYSFEGPFGTFSAEQLQRGYKVYKEVCSNCHAMHMMYFRNLEQPGGPAFSDAQVKALAASFTVKDGPNDAGEMYDRPGVPSDPFPLPFPNEQAARAANGGALPPSLTLITKARAGWTGTFAQLFFGMGGPEYVYSVLTGYQQAPADLAKQAPQGKFYNPYFENGPWISMPPPLSDGQVSFDDGAPNKVDDMARDVSAFLAWAGEPKLVERRSAGFPVIIYLVILAVLLYLVKQKIWSRIEH